MKVEIKGHTTLIKDTKEDLVSFLLKLTNEFKTFENHNLIIDISNHKNLTVKDITTFSALSKQHKKAKKSFVIVASNINYNSVPTALTVVPSKTEAHDIIEMEEIERDLGF